MGCFPIVMPENYIALFDAPEEAEARKIIAAAQPALERGIGCIRSGRDFPAVKAGLTDKLKSGIVNAAFYRFIVRAKPFTVSDACIRCGKCEKVCPQHLHIRDLLADVAAEFEKRAERIALSPAFRISELPQARQGTSRWRAFRRLHTDGRNTGPRRRGCRAPR